MCAYNGVNGSHACSNKLSLGKWLHDELNFQGFVLSDYGAVFLGGEVDAANAGCDSVIGNSQYPYNGSMSTSGKTALSKEPDHTMLI
jgi:beta-glucosidase